MTEGRAQLAASRATAPGTSSRIVVGLGLHGQQLDQVLLEGNDVRTGFPQRGEDLVVIPASGSVSEAHASGGVGRNDPGVVSQRPRGPHATLFRWQGEEGSIGYVAPGTRAMTTWATGSTRDDSGFRAVPAMEPKPQTKSEGDAGAAMNPEASPHSRSA